MIRTWKIAKTKLNEVRFDDNSSLDAVTRQLPNGWYSTFRTFDKCSRAIGLSAHLRRLPNADASLLRASLTQALQPFRAAEARVRMTETRRGRFYISIEPLKLLPREIYEQGVRVKTTTLQRRDPRAKATAFIGTSGDERERLARENIFEALLVKNGKILEGLTSNFFWIGQIGNLPYLATAQRGILLGVTRTMVIRAARERGLEVRFSPLRLDQLSLAKEAFITSSSRGVVPVVQIDDARVGQGSPGKATRMLMSAYEEYALKRVETIAARDKIKY